MPAGRQVSTRACLSLQLVHNFPPHTKTTAGAPFWSGTKRAPTPLHFDASSPLHLDFIVSAANLQAAVYGLKGCQDRSALTHILHTLHVPPFTPKVRGAGLEGRQRQAGVVIG